MARITTSQLNILIQQGHDVEGICTYFECEPLDLEKHVQTELGRNLDDYLEYKRLQVQVQIENQQFSAAQAGNNTMLRHVGKVFYGQRTKSTPKPKPLLLAGTSLDPDRVRSAEPLDGGYDYERCCATYAILLNRTEALATPYANLLLYFPTPEARNQALGQLHEARSAQRLAR